jgi:CheY-like chemotaxis protein
MPEMDGFDATKLIRKFESGKNIHIPIVAMTAHAMKGDREKCLAAGMDFYITKPVNPNELYETIEKFQRKFNNHTTSKILSISLHGKPRL